MREIKFRTFVKKDKKMLLRNHSAMAVKMFTPNYAYLNDEVEVMQFTGVKDSSGNEVYEGDILSISDRESNQIVYFDNEGCWGTEEFALFELVRNKERTFKVVGNKYENPELI